MFVTPIGEQKTTQQEHQTRELPTVVVCFLVQQTSFYLQRSDRNPKNILSSQGVGIASLLRLGSWHLLLPRVLFT